MIHILSLNKSFLFILSDEEKISQEKKKKQLAKEYLSSFVFLLNNRIEKERYIVIIYVDDRIIG